MVNNQIPGNTVDAEGNPIPPIQTDVPEAAAPVTLAELRSMMAQLLQKVNDQEQANRSLAQQLEVATSQGRIRTTRFGARQLQDRRAATDLNPTRLVFHTPGNTTRPVSRTAPEIGRDRTEPAILGNRETNRTERNEPQLPPPRAEVAEADQIGVSDDEDSEENIRWAEEYAREQEIRAIKLSLAKAENEIKLLRSQMHNAVSSAPNIDRILEESHNTPFTHRISNAIISDPGKLRIEYFNGSSDPKGHLKSFIISVARAKFRPEERDAGLCHLFVEHLKGPALYWSSRLEGNSVDSFQELSTLFLKQYSVLIDPGTSDADIMVTISAA